MALSNRDCPHGRQAGKCSDCDVSELERQIEQDEALIRQLVEALENSSDLVFKDTTKADARDLAIAAARARLGRPHD